MRELIVSLQASDNQVYLADLDPIQRTAVEHSGLADLVGPDGIVWREDRIGAAATEAARRGHQSLAAALGDLAVTARSRQGKGELPGSRSPRLFATPRWAAPISSLATMPTTTRSSSICADTSNRTESVVGVMSP